MGADLYIKNEATTAMMDDMRQVLLGTADFDAARSRAMSVLNSEDYFRDAYNGLNVLHTLGMSWADDVIPLLVDGCLSGQSLIDFQRKIESMVQILPTAEMLKKNHVQIDEYLMTVEAWHDFLLEKREKLRNFLSRAIRTESEVICSL